MNHFVATIQSAYDEYLTKLKQAMDGLTEEELYRQPGPETNHIGWIVWHMARVEDHWINGRLLGQTHVWNDGGWDRKFGMGADDRGVNHTIEQVRAMPRIGQADLLGYFDAVRNSTSKVIEGLDEELLGREVQHPRMGAITGAWIIGHVIVEESQHVGQVAMTRGMLRGFGG